MMVVLLLSGKTKGTDDGGVIVVWLNKGHI